MTRLTPLIVAIIFVFSGCVKNVNADEPTGNPALQVRELVNHVAAKEHEVYACRHKKNCWNVALLGTILKENGLDFNGFMEAALVQGRVIRKDKTLTLTAYFGAQNKTTGIWTTYGEIFIDKGADGWPEYAKCTKIYNKEIALEIEFRDGEARISGSPANFGKEISSDDINALYWKAVALTLKNWKEKKVKVVSPTPLWKY